MITFLALAALAAAPDAGVRMDTLTIAPQATADAEAQIRGHIELETPTVSGSEGSVADVADYVGKRKAALLSCYEKALRQQPGLKTTVRITFDVNPTGRPLTVSATADVAGQRDLALCLVGAVRPWKLPVAAAAPAKVEFTLHCAPAGF